MQNLGIRFALETTPLNFPRFTQGLSDGFQQTYAGSFSQGLAKAKALRSPSESQTN
jgi:hypothetical protein